MIKFTPSIFSKFKRKPKLVKPKVMLPMVRRSNPMCMADRLLSLQQGIDGKFYFFDDDMLKPDYGEWNW